MNLYREAGELLLGSRLKRLSERYLSEISRVYRTLDIEFDPSWFPVFFLIERDGTVKISQLAEELQISQSGATQLIKGLERKGLLEEFQAEGRDRRTKNVRFTSEGRRLLNDVRPVWNALACSMRSLLEEGSNSRIFLPAMAELEDEFDETPLGDRVLYQLSRKQLIEKLSLTQWSSSIDESYRKVLLELLSAPFVHLNPDSQFILQHPEKSLPGMELLLLSASKKVIGFAVLSGNKLYEISVLFISPDWEGCGIEESFISLIETQAGERTELTLSLRRDQSFMLSASKKSGYKLLSWEGNLIAVRKEK
ncbi:MAG: MarR family transcriptional regulator [Spirochaetales bacterium]|nr:MarR family transcriptional regulator [Spirochaetales bacterium]